MVLRIQRRRLPSRSDASRAFCHSGSVRKAFHHYYGRGRTFKEETIRRRAAAWGPYQTLAVHYLLAGMRLSKPTVGGGT